METLALIVRNELILISVLLIIVVLVQKSKSAGMGAAFGGDTASFTTKGKAASKEAKLQKITIALAVTLGVLALVLTVIS